MADTKISALTAATTPLAGTEVLPIVQSGVTKKVSVADLTAGRTVGMTQINSASATEPPILANSTGTEYGKTVKAWVNGNGNTGAIRTSFNCSSFQKSSTGVYVMNFTNSMADGDYCVVMGYGDTLTSNQGFMSRNASTTTSVTVRMWNGTITGLTDFDPVYLAIFR